MNSIIMQIALSQWGIAEILGKKDNPSVIKYFKSLGFAANKFKDETAWCSAFANWVAKTAGAEFSGKLNARSWLKVGSDVATPMQGDIVVFWRESPTSWKGHVAFFIKETATHVYVLGGNQGNKVCIKAYNKDRVLDYRRLNLL